MASAALPMRDDVNIQRKMGRMERRILLLEAALETGPNAEGIKGGKLVTEGELDNLRSTVQQIMPLVEALELRIIDAELAASSSDLASVATLQESLPSDLKRRLLALENPTAPPVGADEEATEARINALEKRFQNIGVAQARRLDDLELWKSQGNVAADGTPTVADRLEVLEEDRARIESRTFAANSRLDALEATVAATPPKRKPGRPAGSKTKKKAAAKKPTTRSQEEIEAMLEKARQKKIDARGPTTESRAADFEDAS